MMGGFKVWGLGFRAQGCPLSDRALTMILHVGSSLDSGPSLGHQIGTAHF